MKKRMISVFLVVCLVVSAMTSFSFAGETSKYREAKDKTAEYMLSILKNPQYGDEFFITSLTRGGVKIPQALLDEYVKNIEKTMKDCKGVLHQRKYTEYSRLSIALTAIGKDPRNIAGYNLHKKLADFEKTKWQGVNGSIWALIAFDTMNYSIPDAPGDVKNTTRDLLIEDILNAEVPGGGFVLGGFGNDPDSDITGMALQALAPYYNKRDDVKKAVDKAVNVLSMIQYNDGGFGTIGAPTCESCCQVIMGLTALGIDPDKDPRFIKNGKSVIDALLTYYEPETGGFRHVNKAVPGYPAVVNAMATEQSFYALSAYERFQQGRNRYYDMTDIQKKVTKPAKAVITSAKSYKSKTAVIKWKSVKGAKGYQVKYKTKSGKSRYTYTTRTSRTLTKLSRGSRYYVQVRAYKTTKSGKKVYGNYSNTKVVRVK